MDSKRDNLKVQFLKAYPKKACNISRTCESLGMKRTTYYHWRKTDADFAHECEMAEESLIDLAETQLFRNIREGKETSLIFFLKCKAKKRGYIEKQEFEHSGKIDTVVNIIPASHKNE